MLRKKRLICSCNETTAWIIFLEFTAAYHQRETRYRHRRKRQKRREKRKWESRTPAVLSCWETSGDGCWRERLSDRQRYKALMSKTKRVLLASIQFPFIWTCVCFQRKCGECKSSEGTVWEQRHITCMWGDSGVCTQCVSACRVCVCASGGYDVFFFMLFSCMCVCGWVERTWEEDALPHTYARDLLHTACPQSVCECVSEPLHPFPPRWTVTLLILWLYVIT